MSSIASALRIQVSIGWVVAWNLLIGGGLWVNGGFTPPLPSHLAQLLVGTALFGTACFAAAIAALPRVNVWALRTGSNSDSTRRELWFVAFLSAALGIGMCVSSFGQAGV
jgi:hypothetical protein